MKKITGIIFIIISLVLVEKIPLPLSMKISLFNLLVPVFLGSLLPAILCGTGVTLIAKENSSPW